MAYTEIKRRKHGQVGPQPDANPAPAAPAAPVAPAPQEQGMPSNMPVKMQKGADDPYNMNLRQSKYEQAADVQPNKYYSIMDEAGNVKDSYRVDPTKSAAFQKISGIANSTDLSPWASLQMQQNQLQTAQQRDRANAQGMGANEQAMQKLMSTGGGSNSGAAAFLASQGMKNQMMQNQDIGMQSAQNALGISANDAQMKQNMLGQVANAETAAQQANAGNAIQDTQGANMFTANRYKELMGAWGAEQSANAQAAAARSGRGGKK